MKNWNPLHGEDLIFPSAHGTPLNSSNVTNCLKTILGHSQIAQTANAYGHLTKKLAAAAMRMQRALSDDKTEPLTTKVTTDSIASADMGSGEDAAKDHESARNWDHVD